MHRLTLRPQSLRVKPYNSLTKQTGLYALPGEKLNRGLCEDVFDDLISEMHAFLNKGQVGEQKQGRTPSEAFYDPAVCKDDASSPQQLYLQRRPRDLCACCLDSCD